MAMKGPDPMPDTNGDFDDLLGDAPTPVERANADPTTPAPSPEADRIRELEEQIALLTAKGAAAEKSTQEKDAEHAAALLASRNIETSSAAFEEGDGDEVTLHFLDDGITAFGRVWEKGQEVSYIRGGTAYQESKDRNGRSWLDHLSAEEQYARWGRLRVGFGPYPIPLKVPENLIDPEEKARGRRAPVFA